MNWNKSYFNISAPLLEKDLRKLWPLSAIAALVYFFAGIFPILLNYQDLSKIDYSILGNMYNSNVIFLVVLAVLPTFSAIMVFRYLHSQSSAAVIHAMPFTRCSLFQTHFLSGLLLSLAPVLVNGTLLLLLSKPVPIEIHGAEGTITADAFSRLLVCRWMLDSCITILFVYAIAVLAAIVTGTVLMHLLVSAGLNLLLPAVCAAFQFYSTAYLFGYGSFDVRHKTESLMFALSPVLRPITFNVSSFTWQAACAYLAAALVIVAISALLYQKRPLEKATDFIVFSFVRPVICFLTMFGGLTAFGFYFEQLSPEESSLRMIGYILGGLIGFILGEMLTRQTLRIANRQALKHLALYSLLSVFIVCCFQFDVTGYEKRLPDPENINSVYINLWSRAEMPGLSIWVSDQESIAEILAFQKELVARKDTLSVSDSEPESKRPTIHITYSDKDGRHIQGRSYPIPFSAFKADKHLEKIYESRELQGVLNDGDGGSFDMDNPVDMAVLSHPYRQDTQQMVITSGLDQLAACMNRDFRERTFADHTSGEIPYVTIVLRGTDEAAYQQALKKNPKATKRDFSVDAMFEIYPSETHTLGWLAANGYLQYTDYDLDSMLYAVVTSTDIAHDDLKLDESDYTEGVPSGYLRHGTSYVYNISRVPESTGSAYVLTDPDKVRSLLHKGATELYEITPYQCTIVFDSLANNNPTFTFDLPEDCLPQNILSQLQ